MQQSEPKRIIAGIESSCDDSGIALYDEARGSCFEWLSSQNESTQFGGVIPEIAARTHSAHFLQGIEKLIAFLEREKCVLDAIAYTAGPGLMGSLWIGGMWAQSLAWHYSLPLIEVDHLEAHIFSAFIGQPMVSIPFPFLALLVSGGHTQLWDVRALGQYQLLGATRDDAAGEAFDKAAKALGLPYPGGPSIGACARQGYCGSVKFPQIDLGPQSLDFSFSGLKSAMHRKVKEYAVLSDQVRADLAHAFEERVIGILMERCQRALRRTGLKRLVVVGGVSANQALKKKLYQTLSPENIEVYMPSARYTGDNGAMVAYLGYLRVADRLSQPTRFSMRPLLLYPTTREVRLSAVCALQTQEKQRGDSEVELKS